MDVSNYGGRSPKTTKRISPEVYFDKIGFASLIETGDPILRSRLGSFQPLAKAALQVSGKSPAGFNLGVNKWIWQRLASRVRNLYPVGCSGAQIIVLFGFRVISGIARPFGFLR